MRPSPSRVVFGYDVLPAYAILIAAPQWIAGVTWFRVGRTLFCAAFLYQSQAVAPRPAQ